MRVFWGLPGTGKTWKLFSMVKSYQDDGFELSDMCINTFRRSMAREISRKLKVQFDARKEDLALVGTTHGICCRIEGIRSIATEYDKRFFCKEIMKIPYMAKGEREFFEIYEDTLGETLFSIKSWLTANIKNYNDWWQVPISKSFRHPLSRTLVEDFIT